MAYKEIVAINKCLPKFLFLLFSDPTWAARGGGPPADPLPLFAFIGLLAVYGIAQFFKSNKDIGAIVGGLLVMVIVSISAAVLGAKVGFYSRKSILIFGCVFFLVWLFYPVALSRFRGKPPT
jgi:hypothetical protein